MITGLDDDDDDEAERCGVLQGQEIIFEELNGGEGGRELVQSAATMHYPTSQQLIEWGRGLHVHPMGYGSPKE